MNQYVGLDVSQDQTSICVVDEGDRVLWQGRCASTPEAIAATLGSRAPQAERIGLESGPLSIWLCHGLSALGLPVVCLDARHAEPAPGRRGPPGRDGCVPADDRARHRRAGGADLCQHARRSRGNPDGTADAVGHEDGSALLLM